MSISPEKLYIHAPYRMLLENLDVVRQRRINCEIYIDAEALDTHTPDEISLINSTFNELALRKRVHGPFMDLNPGSLDPGIRKLTQKRLLQAVEFCTIVGSEDLVFHTGFHPIFYGPRKDKWLDLSIGTWHEVLDEAMKRDITICIENSIDTSPQIIIKLIQKMDSSNFRATFDIGHYNVFGEIPPFECLRMYPPEFIIELHLSDNNGDLDAHLVLGQGNIDFKRLFSEISKMGIDPIVTVEPNKVSDIGASLRYLAKVGTDTAFL